MDSISLADAQAHLSELVDRAAAGETVQITLEGQPVAQITPITKPCKPIDLNWLREVTKDMTFQEESAGDFIRRMRDEDRY